MGEKCKALTGLDEATLAAGTSLQECVKEFNDYLYKQFTSQNIDFCFVTDGDARWKFSKSLASHQIDQMNVQLR